MCLAPSVSVTIHVSCLSREVLIRSPHTFLIIPELLRETVNYAPLCSISLILLTPCVKPRLFRVISVQNRYNQSGTV